MTISTANRRPGSHRGSRGTTGTDSAVGLDVGRHRARAQRNGGRRVLATATFAASLVAVPALTSPASAHPSYTVQSGDTLSSIAQDIGSTWRDLYRANRNVIASPTSIYPGQSLQTGGKGSAGQAALTSTVGGGGGGSADQSAGSFEQQLLNEASQLEGIPYIYGGSTPAGFDCSGFTSYAFAQAGKTIPRTSSEQAAAATPVSGNDLRPGDLIFYSPGGSVSHVAIYAGDGMVWEAASTGTSVRYAPVWNVARSYGRF
ncbi:C40 family peptidase [Nocardioides kribbensis]|uniref:LysM peptidoglycan-binding domain-containing C40 family peptidase n=1 Tax=Nocardioides kribbensis TaxID=305517 RepID=A0ABV1NT58_9ACTN